MAPILISFSLSGRGVGLDVVVSNLRRRGGEVSVQTEPGHGTTFTLSVPKGVSPVTEGWVVRVGHVTYLLSQKAIVRFFSWDDIDEVDLPGGNRVASLAHGTMGVCRLEGGEEVAGTLASPMPSTGLLIHDRRGRQCLLPVGEVIGLHRVLISAVNARINHSPVVKGTFILGNGTMGFAVDADRLVADTMDNHTPTVPLSRTGTPVGG